MQNSSNKPCLIFLHIPKAAGTTLHRITSRQYRQDQIYTIAGKRVKESLNEFVRLPLEERSQLRCVKGHMYFGLHTFLPQPSTYVTLLRNPVERVISFYHFVLNRPDHPLHDNATSQKMGLSAFIQSGISLEFDNVQTRLLSGFNNMVVKEGVETAVSVEFGACTNDMLEKAKRNLREQFAVVGLSNRFDETVILLKREFGWRFPFYGRRNVTQIGLKKNISVEDLLVVKRYNALDADLHEYAQTLFEETLKGQPPSFLRDLRVYRAINKPFSHPKVDSLARVINRQYRKKRKLLR